MNNNAMTGLSQDDSPAFAKAKVSLVNMPKHKRNQLTGHTGPRHFVEDGALSIKQFPVYSDYAITDSTSRKILTAVSADERSKDQTTEASCKNTDNDASKCSFERD